MTFQTDQGYSWVVLFAVFMLNVHFGGGAGTHGIFLVEFFQYFQVSKATITILTGLHLSIGFIMGFPISWLCNIVGFRPVAIAAAVLSAGSLLASSFAPNIAVMYVTFGVMASVGRSTLYNTGSMAVQLYFDKKRGLASGVVICGISVGVFIWPPFIRWVIDLYGWRGAFMINAGIHLHALAFALLLRPIPKVVSVQQPAVPQETELSAHTNDDDRVEEARTECLMEKSKAEPDKHGRERGGGRLSIFRILTDYPLLIPHLFGVCAIQIGHTIPYSLVPVRAKALNIDKTRAATLMSIIGIVSLCVRVVLGYVGDIKYVHRGLLCGLSGLLASAITALSSLFTTYTLMAIYSGLWAILAAPYVALQAAAVVDIVGVENTETGIGYLSLAIGIASLTALSVSGLILDRLTDPKYVFLFIGSEAVLGGLIVVSTASVNIWWKRKKSTNKRLNT